MPQDKEKPEEEINPKTKGAGRLLSRPFYKDGLSTLVKPFINFGSDQRTLPRRQVVFRPKSVGEIKKHLKPPLCNVSAVIYFTENDDMPFLLDSTGGISAGAEYRLSRGWEPTRDKLHRFIIVTMEEYVDKTPADETDTE
jgi:hypothetical protein